MSYLFVSAMFPFISTHPFSHRAESARMKGVLERSLGILPSKFWVIENGTWGSLNGTQQIHWIFYWEVLVPEL